MAKAAYKPTQMLREDPLAALKQATEERAVVDQAVPKNEEAAKPIAAAPPEKEQRIEPAGNPAVDRKPFRSGNAGSSIAPVKPLAKSLNPTRNTVYLYPEDLTKLRQLSGYASTNHGIRTNDSVIVRAALSLVEPDVRFMHALEEAMQSDRRKASSK
jgi:hypothetical protein